MKETLALLNRILITPIIDVGRTKPEDHDERGRWAKKDGISKTSSFNPIQQQAYATIEEMIKNKQADKIEQFKKDYSFDMRMLDEYLGNDDKRNATHAPAILTVAFGDEYFEKELYQWEKIAQTEKNNEMVEKISAAFRIIEKLKKYGEDLGIQNLKDNNIYISDKVQAKVCAAYFSKDKEETEKIKRNIKYKVDIAHKLSQISKQGLTTDFEYDIVDTFTHEQVESVVDVYSDFIEKHKETFKKGTIKITDKTRNYSADFSNTVLAVVNGRELVLTPLWQSANSQSQEYNGKSEERGFHPPHTTLQSIVQHEMGHLLSHTIGDGFSCDIAEKLNNACANDIGAFYLLAEEYASSVEDEKRYVKNGNKQLFQKYVLRAAFDTLEEDIGEFGKVRKIIGEEISGYAALGYAREDLDEIIAESYSDVYSNGDSASNKAKIIVNKMEEIAKIPSNKRVEYCWNDLDNNTQQYGEMTGQQKRDIKLLQLYCKIFDNPFDTVPNYDGKTKYGAELFLSQYKNFEKYARRTMVYLTMRLGGKEMFRTEEEYERAKTYLAEFKAI